MAEVVIRGKANENHDLYVKMSEDGDVELSLQSKNGTGWYNFTIPSEDFDFIYRVREEFGKKKMVH